MSPVEQSSQNQYLHPLGTFPCDHERPPIRGNPLSSSDKHSSVPTTRVLAHLLLRWTLIAPAISSGQHSKSFIPLIILDIDLERLQLIQAVLTQAGGTPLLMHLFIIASLPMKISLQLPLISLSFCRRAMWYRQPRSKEHFGGFWGGLFRFFWFFNAT